MAAKRPRVVLNRPDGSEVALEAFTFKPDVPAKRPRVKSPYRAAPVRPATDRQNEYLAAVAALTLANGEPPSASAVAAWLGVSRISARQQLQALETKGLLVDVPRVVSSGKWALVSKG